MLMISERQRNIIELLSRSKIPITSKSLAEQFNVSTKTVRNDIKYINESSISICIHSKPGVGYLLSSGRYYSETQLNNPNYNKFELLKRIIDDSSVDLYKVSDELYVSESTLVNWVNELNKVIMKNNPKLKIRRMENRLEITGTEKERRHVFNLFLDQELRKNKLSLDKYYDFFDFVNLNDLVANINQLHNDEKIKLNDFSTISFVLHIAVLLERVHNKSYIDFKNTEAKNKDCVQYTNNLVKFIEEKYEMKLPTQEIIYIYHLYIGELKLADVDTNDDLKRIIENVLVNIKNTFYIDFSKDKELTRYLRTHIEGLMQRAAKGKFLINPLTNDIKSKYPFIYNISVYASLLIQNDLQFKFPDDEIAYIALHFLSSYEIIQDDKSKNVLFVSPYGVSEQRFIKSRLDKIENYSINFKVISPLDKIESNLKDIDLVLSESEIAIKSNVKQYVFKKFLTDDDLKNIENIFKVKRTGHEKMILEKFLDPKMFFTNLDLKNSDEVIRFLCKKLIEYKYVPENYTKLVLEREGVSSTAYSNNFAIPHAIQRVANKNVIAVCSLNKAIEWSGKRVRIILLLAFKSERTSDFENIFGEISMIFDEPNFVNRLSREHNYSDFLRLCNTKLILSD